MPLHMPLACQVWHDVPNGKARRPRQAILIAHGICDDTFDTRYASFAGCFHSNRCKMTVSNKGAACCCKLCLTWGAG
jgi:hypothetical protein